MKILKEYLPFISLFAIGIYGWIEMYEPHEFTVYALFAFLLSLALTVILCKKIYNIKKVQLIRNSSNKLIQFLYPIFSIIFQITLFFLIFSTLLYFVEMTID